VTQTLGHSYSKLNIRHLSKDLKLYKKKHAIINECFINLKQSYSQNQNFLLELKPMYDKFELHCHGQADVEHEFLETDALKQQ